MTVSSTEASRKWRERHPEKYKETYASYALRNSEKVKYLKRNCNFVKKYGITIEQWNEILKLQEYKCKICKTSFDLSMLRSIHVDHSHSTNKVRGILCASCNHLLGLARDDIEILTSAIQYLKEV